MILATDIVMALRPCSDWPRERVAAALGCGRHHHDVLGDGGIPASDRAWLGIALLGERDRRLFACDCAERQLERERAAGREPDARSWAAVEVARRYARGEATSEELSAAGASAWDAASDAWAAAGAAAWAAWAAARDAARDAWAAAGDAAWYAERAWQCARLADMIDAAERGE